MRSLLKAGLLLAPALASALVLPEPYTEELDEFIPELEDDLGTDRPFYSVVSFAKLTSKVFVHAVAVLDVAVPLASESDDLASTDVLVCLQSPA
jgi:hypothetical protein